MTRPALAVLALALNALVWGLSWWPLRQLDVDGLHPLWTTACVFTLATVVLSFISPSGWVHFKQHPQLWWLMAASGLTNVGFNWAVTTGDVVRVVLLFYLMPTWSLLLAWWLLGERPTRGALTRLGLALMGVVLVLKTPESPWPLPQDLSDLLAILGGFCFALTNIWLLRLQHTSESSRMIAMFSGGALMAVACAVLATLAGVAAWVPHASVTEQMLTWSPWVLGLSAAFLVSNFALQYGAARLSAHTTAMVMMSEVVFASVSSVALGASTLTWRVGLGGGMIVLAALLASQAHTPKDPTP
ncbi:DMT family transporter [Limnohabitans sp.]|jgi:drug/metabolite transporter (DMT)-like permease|uniref:DMT family transporter n=1 Tax=Limnohabitans sp. TaxID=1907725 RepID=UPI00286F132B|nr:DMT family transporter [Limnohabitans sp.]